MLIVVFLQQKDCLNKYKWNRPHRPRDDKEHFETRVSDHSRLERRLSLEGRPFPDESSRGEEGEEWRRMPVKRRQLMFVVQIISGWFTVEQEEESNTQETIKSRDKEDDEDQGPD
jgi:hypothetical protein